MVYTICTVQSKASTKEVLSDHGLHYLHSPIYGLYQRCALVMVYTICTVLCQRSALIMVYTICTVLSMTSIKEVLWSWFTLFTQSYLPKKCSDQGFTLFAQSYLRPLPKKCSDHGLHYLHSPIKGLSQRCALVMVYTICTVLSKAFPKDVLWLWFTLFAQSYLRPLPKQSSDHGLHYLHSPI